MTYQRYAIKLSYGGKVPPFHCVVTAKDEEHAVTVAKYESLNNGWPRVEPITIEAEIH